MKKQAELCFLKDVQKLKAESWNLGFSLFVESKVDGSHFVKWIDSQESERACQHVLTAFVQEQTGLEEFKWTD